MCTYCNTKNYRNIYENHFGPIPKDSNGKSFDIHHLDGNHENNDPMNLIAVSISDHLKIHDAQKDYGACFLICSKHGISDMIGQYASASNFDRKVKGVHNFAKSGPEAVRYDHTIYTFKHRITGEVLSCGRQEFRTRVGGSHSSVSNLVRKKIPVYKDWELV